MEETVKRGWVKNTIIVFLAVMLVLTLFSNTIMNRSLPEVSVQYGQSGTIQSQIKLSGNVIANQTRTVTLEQSRKIDTVFVRRGDVVTRGTVLATLVAGESEAIYDAEIELKRMELAYQQALLPGVDSLTAQRRALADAQASLAELEAYMAAYPTYESEIAGYEGNINQLTDAKKDLELSIEETDASIAALKKQLAGLSDSGYTDPQKLSNAINEAKIDAANAQKALTAAKRAYDKALSAYNSASTLYSVAQKDYNEAVLARQTLEKKLDEEKNGLGALETALTAANDKVAEKQAAYDTLNAVSPKPDPYPELDAALAALNDAKTEQTAAQTALDAKQAAIAGLEAEITAAKAAESDLLDDYTAKGTVANTSYATYQSAESAYNSCKITAKNAEDYVERLSEGFDYTLLQSRVEKHEENRSALQKQVTEYEAAIALVHEKIAAVREKMVKSMKDCEHEQLSLNRTIEDCQKAIKDAEQSGRVDDATSALELEIKKNEIDRKKREIAKMKDQVTSTELTAPASGTVTAVYIASGDNLDAGASAFEIILDDMGYTMECTVTNAQASRLQVGQTADVLYYYWGAKPTVRVSAIKTDTSSGGKNKTVIFTVEGEISNGTNLSISLGGQNTNYDTVVPNSAIREDANGKFVLRVISKSSPLGNRYYAERVDVNVLASDATQSAIDASFSWGDYIITKASVPISDGMQVRVSE